MSSNGRQGAMAALAGAGAALAVLSTPVGLLEMLVSSAGISEALPAAGPPLGLTARLLMAGFAAVMAMAIGWAVQGHHHRDPASGTAQGDRKMGFAFSRFAGSKLATLARRRAAGPPRPYAAPVLRRADAHPDAPARAPIFASRDFGGATIFASIADELLPEAPVAMVSAEGLDLPRAPAPLDDADLPPIPGFAMDGGTAGAIALPVAGTDVAPVLPGPSFVPAFVAPVVEAAVEPPAALPSGANPDPVDARPLSTLSIGELTERLERGLSHRAPARAAAAPRVIAEMPVAEAVAVRPAVEPDLDEALRAALGTLRTMASRAR